MSDDESESSLDNDRNQSKPELNHTNNQRQFQTMPPVHYNETRNQRNRQINGNGYFDRDENEVLRNDLKRLKKENEEISSQLRVIL